MAAIGKSLVWFYQEFGLASLRETGRNAYLIILARSLRMLAYGTNALILALFFSELGFSDRRIGVFMTLTLVGDVFLGTFLTLVADRFGRRKILFGGSILMVFTGAIFAAFENFWILLFAAVIGVVSATGGDFGPFRSIEESMLSQLTTSTTRADVLAWYVTTSAWGSSIGSELGGRIIEGLQHRDGWTLKDAYHAIFWVYAIMGVVNIVLVLLLTKDCEADTIDEKYTKVAQQDESDDSYVMTEHPDRGSAEASRLPAPTKPVTRFDGVRSWVSKWMGDISKPTLSVVWKLWILLAVDSLADGMVPYSLTNYYMDNKFHPAKSTLGDVTSISYFLTAIGGIFAGPLAKKIGLVNTMVFTHIPSSAAVLFFPLPNVFWMTIILLFLRAGLNNMDQAPRSALIAAIVKPQERTAVMGITSMLRTLAATSGPMVTGFLAGSNRFWVAFVAGGAFRLAYDVGLWILFTNVKLHQHEIVNANDEDDQIASADQFRLSDEEESLNGQSSESDHNHDTLRQK
ncbi:Putative major facilitator superfamily, MFS transporter superfamily [Septoria linicola]|uniref:Major facilitator superfamily, MFS transporter superfamily n=1 Tax=Septoria linicola TaxID=215465 RepID=A0A9Q9B1M0_9PEZI|nr:putative major facilitator superfamily, MFS transporter superfamily [Septoria linicola]USW59304.1 Putative major facilitator superfamily, MFS transporter superfamily [Septoria linicola]